MRSKVVKTLALALLLGGVSFVMGQPPQKPRAEEVEENAKTQPDRKKKRVDGEDETPKRKIIRVEEEESAPPARQMGQQKKSNLEEMLAEALKNNPDLRVAAAKLAEADAELNRTRIQVTQQVVNLHHAILSQKAMVEVAQKKYDRMKGLAASNAVGSDILDNELTILTMAKAKLVELEAQMPALLGRGRSSAGAGAVHPGTALYGLALNERNYDLEVVVPDGRLAVFQAKPNMPQAEKIRKALQTPVKVDYKDMTFDAILKDLAKKAEGLSFRNLFERGGGLNVQMPKMSLRFEEALPISAILQALADETGCSFFVREYGILAIRRETAPRGMMTVEEFLRKKPADEPRRQPAGAKNPPADGVEGRVKAVDASGMMTISIGSDAGLAKGHTLELFRLNPSAPSQSRYLGTVRVLEAEAHQAVVQPVGRLTAPPQLGDRVASRIQGGN